MTVGAERLAADAGAEDGGAGEVALLRWPADDAERRSLAARGRPRLLLVGSDVPAPVCEDPLEDWVRLPAADDDVGARVTALVLRSATLATPDRPVIDTDGVVRLGERWAALPPVEARLMTALVERFGAVVHRDDLALAGWPEGLPGRNALDVHVLRLRRRIASMGLVIRTIRARGYLLEVDQSATERSEAEEGDPAP